MVRNKYPAYVDWEAYEKIQAMLHDNRAEYMRLKSRGVPRDGAALLHGIVWCGECGHKMTVRYKGGSQYVCNHLRQQYGEPECQCLRAGSIDAEVAAAFLEAVAPAEMNAWVRARKAQRHADASLHRAEQQQAERLRYHATLAERQFNRVDPDNRLVASELERRWESALVELRQAEDALARRKAAAATAVDKIEPQLRAQVVSLGRRLPELWADPNISRAHRKALLRCLIEKVVMRRTARDKASVRIVWRGGEVTDLTVMMPVNALTALPRYAEMEARVLQLAQSGIYDDEIAQRLTAEGFRSPRRGGEVLRTTIQGIRLRHGIHAVRRSTRWPQVSGWLTVTQIAARLTVSENWVRGRIRRGAIKTTREASGRYLFLDDEQTIKALRQLHAGAVKQINLAQDVHRDRGYQHA